MIRREKYLLLKFNETATLPINAIIASLDGILDFGGLHDIHQHTFNLLIDIMHIFNSSVIYIIRILHVLTMSCIFNRV